MAPDGHLVLHFLYEEGPRDPSKGFEAQVLFENLGNGCPGHQEVSGLAPDAAGGVGLDLGVLGLQTGYEVLKPFLLAT